jgi:hypothetical protein
MTTFAILWFDVEDFINPETDDMPLRIAKIMSKHRVKVVFKIVGEKLRTLKRHGRKDVIEAMAEHDIGYHSNLHSIHPTPTEYIGSLDWDSGVEEFEKREEEGYLEIKKTYGKSPICYGHPGLSWVPQAYPVLNKWRIPVYLDETFTLPSINERPFWYCNMLNIMCIRSNVLTLDAGVSSFPIDKNWLLKLPSEFKKIYDKLERQETPGVISVYCHPTTYATEEWWENGNFLKGKNPDKMIFKRAKLKTKEKTEEDLKLLDQFIIDAKKLPNLKFITASDAIKIYKDKADGRSFLKSELGALCRQSIKSIYYYRVNEEVWVSPAEIFAMVLEMLVRFSEKRRLPEKVVCRVHPYGPKAVTDSVISSDTINLDGLIRSCQAGLREIRRSGYLPSRFEVGDYIILSTADMFITVCGAYLELLENKNPTDIKVLKGVFDIGKTVTLEGAKKDWSYHLNPDGFEALKQVELARLQTWTLKPAVADLKAIEEIG